MEVANPYFTYSGSYDYVEYETGKYYVKLLTSGTFTPKVNFKADTFLVGGGGGGGNASGTGSCSGGNGGAGGYTNTVKNISLTSGTGTATTIGDGGGTNGTGASSYFGSYTAAGGNNNTGGSGGGAGGGRGGSGTNNRTGGKGGFNGNNGYDDGDLAYQQLKATGGQGTTTYAFGGDKEPFNTAAFLFAGGGGGGGGSSASQGTDLGGSGGSGGGASGGSYGANGGNATSNTGGGAGGGGSEYISGSGNLLGSGGSGGSGIVMLRWENSAPTITGTVTVPATVYQYSSNTFNISYPTAYDADGDAITYVIEYALNDSGTFTQLTTTTSTTYTFTIPGTKPSNVRFRVKARDTVGLESGYLTSGWVTLTVSTNLT